MMLIINQLPFHTFTNAHIARTALTHKSFGRPHNERYEWLGDAILQGVMSGIIFKTFPTLSEGGLSIIRHRLVSTEKLAQVAARIGLDKHLRLGRTFKIGDNYDRVLAGTTEAYIAAIHFDGGDAREFIKTVFAEDIEKMSKAVAEHGVKYLQDAKTKLQELLHKKRLPLPEYEIISATGVQPNREFTVRCRATEHCEAIGIGGNPKKAEEHAAEQCLKTLQTPTA